MFYPGREKLNSNLFCKVLFEKDSNDDFHKNAYFVKLLGMNGS